MCQGLVLVYSCRHRQVGDIYLCETARRSASNAGCMASLTYMLTGKEPKRNCGIVKTSRRYLLEPCLACDIHSHIYGEPTLTPAQAFARLGNPSTSPSSSSTARQVSPPAESAAFASDPSKYITRPYVGELMSTSAAAATSVAVAVALPKSVVVASSRRSRHTRQSSRPRRSSSSGPSSSARPQSRGRTAASSSSSSSSGSRRNNNSPRSRSTSRGRASAAISAHNLPGSRTSGRRSQSAARRFATSDRLSTVVEDSIPLVPMIPQGRASGNSVGRSVGNSYSSLARLAPPPSIRRSNGPSRATVAASSSSSSSSTPSRSRSKGKGKGKEVVRNSTKTSTTKGKDIKGKGMEVAKEKTRSSSTKSTSKTSKSSSSPTFSEHDLSIRSVVTTSGPAAALGLGVHRNSAAHRHAATGLASGSSAGEVSSYAGPSTPDRPEASTPKFFTTSKVPKTRSPKTGSPTSPSTPPKTGSPSRTISTRLRASKKVAKSEESLLCVDAARIEGNGNFI